MTQGDNLPGPKGMKGVAGSSSKAGDIGDPGDRGDKGKKGSSEQGLKGFRGKDGSVGGRGLPGVGLYGVQSKPKWKYPKDGSWEIMRSQHSSSFKEIEHSLGRYPLACRVYVRPTSGNNKGYIFEARGFNARDDAGYWTQYGGVIYAYSDKAFRLWVPNRNAGGSGVRSRNGKAIMLGVGWGGEVNTTYQSAVEFRIVHGNKKYYLY